MKKLLKGARVIDPSQKIDSLEDVLIVDGRIAVIKQDINLSNVETIDLSGKIITPGLIDIHAHLDSRAMNIRKIYNLEVRALLQGVYHCRLHAKYQSSHR